MHLRLLTVVAAAGMIAFTACSSPYKKSDKARKEKGKDLSGDPSFQAFAGRLRIAVRKRDFDMLNSLMAADFGYRWDTAPAGETAFSFWTEQNLWPELYEIVRGEFAPNGDYMVAPPAFAANPDSYSGYRAGTRMINGAWRFAYFVPAPPAGEQALGE